MVSLLKADPRAPTTLPFLFAVMTQHGWRLQVRFTGGFWNAAIAAQAEAPENQRLVLSEQHYYTRKL
jgi:hypothetical protein